MNDYLQAWFLPMMISALGLGIYDICKKHAVKDNSVTAVLFLATLTGSVIFVIYALFSGKLSLILACPWQHQLLLLLKSMLVASSWMCVYYAMRTMPISIVSPIRASSPLWTFLGAMILYGEFPTILQLLAMVMVFAGYIGLTLLGKMEGFSLKNSPAMYMIFLGTLLGAASALYDKYLLARLNMTAFTVQFYYAVDLVIVLGVSYLVRSLFSRVKHPFQWRWSIPATGIMVLIADYSYFYALSLGDAPISILSLVRRSSCIFAFALGAYIFKDKNIYRKSIALVFILIGVIILGLAK